MATLISIILPTYNGAEFIEGAVRSVLIQTYSNWELLIISDGSVDQTKSIVQQYAQHDTRIRFIENEKNLGIQKTLNKGIALAKGAYIARLDDDDRWVDPEKLAVQAAYLDRHPDCVIVGSSAVTVDIEGKTISRNTMPLTDRAIRSRLLSKNCFLHATVLIRKDVLEKIGGYSEDKKFLHAEDYELWLRLGREGRIANIATYTTALTFHPQSLTTQNRVLQARNVLRAVWQYRQYYPNLYGGIMLATARYIGFAAISVIPLPQHWLHAIQRVYRAI